MSLGLNGSSAGAKASGWKEIARYDTAGTYTWTCPKTATYGVFVVGGGGSGSSSVFSSDGGFISGGASGYSNYAVGTINVNSSHSITVGAGGAGVTSSSSNKSGNAGGMSAFDSLQANGGQGGKVASGSYGNISYNAVGGIVAPYSSDGFYGPGTNIVTTGATSDLTYANHPWMAVNPFTGEPCLGSGGGTYRTKIFYGGKNALTGLGGGNGGRAGVPAENATEFGCGGGAVNCNGNSGAYSGKGGDGIVIIYEKLE